MARDSAEASAEASVDLAEASGFGRTQFWVVRSFTSAYNGTMYSLHTFCLNTTLRVSKVEHVLYSKEESHFLKK